jgi:O-antigen ligase
LVGIYLYRKEINLGFTSISLMTIALLLSLMKIGQVSAPSELYGFAARISFLASWILIAKAAFKKDKENSLQALAMGSQIALIIASVSILHSLVEAYKANDIYLAKGLLFTHKNFAAATLLLLFPLTFIGNSKNSKTNGLHITAIVLAALSIILLRTRGVWLGGLAMVLVATVHFMLRGNKKLRQHGLIALAILIFGMGFTIAVGGSEKIYNSGTIQSRFHYWDASWEMFLDHPVSGVGGGQWKIEYPAQGLKGTDWKVMNGEASILRPHNDLLWMLSETGIFGTLLFLGIVIIGFWQNFKKDGNIYMALVVVGFAVYGFGEFPLERASMLWPLAIALGFAASSLKQRIKGRGNSIFVGALITFTLYVSASRMKSEHSAKEVLDGYYNGLAEKMRTKAQSAESIFFEMDIWNNPMAYFQGYSVLTSNRNNLTNQELTKAQKNFERALEIHPNHLLSLNELAEIHYRKGELKDAEEVNDRVLKISPRNDRATYLNFILQRNKTDIYASLDALKMISPKFIQEKLSRDNYFKQEAKNTLQAFAKSRGPRPSMRGLHQRLQGEPPKQMWSVWTNWRKK